MAGGWYYAHDGEKIGPISGEFLKELAASGAVGPTDTVWKAGVEAGVPAGQIKNLFSPTAPDVAPTVSLAADAETPVPDPAPAEAEPYRPKKQPEAAKKGFATAVVGADIVGQDGKYARYRMKCTACGHKDASCRTIQITNKLTKSGFFCPKCKKRREVAIQCRM